MEKEIQKNNKINSEDVLVEIYKITMVENSYAYLSLLGKRLGVSKDVLDMRISLLIDMGCVNPDFDKINNGKNWARTYYISKDYLYYVRKLYNEKLTNEVKEKDNDREL